MSYKAYNDIKIKCPWELIYINKIQLKQRLNEHAYLIFEAVISEKEAKKIESDLDSEKVELCTMEENNEVTLFSGDIEKASINKRNEIYFLNVKAYSATKRLDLKMNSQSFQDINITYEDLIRKVISKNSKSDVICTIGKGTKINIPIIQYLETDWEFIKRMASHFNTVIVPEVSCNKPRFWFGLPEGKNQELNEYLICKVWSDKKAFNDLRKENIQATINDFYYYEIKTGDDFKIGDKITVEGKSLYIYEKTGNIEQDLWTYTYKLGGEKGLFKKKKDNSKICGMSIIGKVLDTKAELLKVHMEIDKSQDIDKAYWYPYTPQTGNSFYCMPKVGTNVSIYFKDEKEEHAKAVSCVRNNGGTCPKTSDYNNRYFTSEHNKVMNLLPDQINFKGGKEGEPLRFSIRDDGIFVNSKQNLSINGGKNIIFNAKKQVSVSAKGTINIGLATLEQMVLSSQSGEQSNGVITIDAEINFLGTKIYVRGIEAELPSINDAPERRKIDKGKLALGILAAVAAAAVIAAIAAFALPALAVAAGIAGATAGFSLPIFATVMVGASIPVAINVAKDIKRGKASEVGDYLRISSTNALGTAIALIPLGSIFKAYKLIGPVGSLLIGGVGGATTYYSDILWQGKETDAHDRNKAIIINALCNMLPDVFEWARKLKLGRNAGKAVEDFNAEINIEGTSNPGAGKVKTKIRLNPQISSTKIFESYGLSSSYANINKLKAAIVQDPEKYLNLILEDKGLTKQIIENPSDLTSTIENTLPLFVSNGEGEADTVGEWIFGTDPEFSY